MAYAGAQSQLLFIAQRKTDIQYRVMTITNRLDAISIKSSEAYKEHTLKVQNSMFNDESCGKITCEDCASKILSSDKSATAIDEEFNALREELKVQEDRLTQEKLSLETEHKYLNDQEEVYKEMRSNNVKSDHSYFQ